MPVTTVINSLPLHVGDFVRMKDWGEGTPFRVTHLEMSADKVIQIVLEDKKGEEFKYQTQYCPLDQWKVYYHVDPDPREAEMARVRNHKQEGHGMYRMIRIGEE